MSENIIKAARTACRERFGAAAWEAFGPTIRAALVRAEVMVYIATYGEPLRNETQIASQAIAETTEE